MKTKCLCAEARAAESAAHVSLLNARVEALRRQWREQMDISDTRRVQIDDLRRLLEEERDSKLSLLATISEGIAREDAAREALYGALETKKLFFVSVILVLLLAVGDVLRGFLQ